MVFIVNANEQVVGLMSPFDNTGYLSMYDEARSYAYEIPASKGWSGTIVYVFLVYYTVKLLYSYGKRLMIVFILIMLAPIMGIVYAIEMVKGKSKTLTVWMKEFSFNVLIQSVHVLIYSVFMEIVYNQFMRNVSVITLIPYAILTILVFNVMMKSEKLIKKVFGLKANTLKDVTESVIQVSNTLLIGAALLKPAGTAIKNKIGSAYNGSVERTVNNRYKHLENPSDKVAKSKLATDIQKEIDRLKQEEIAQRKAVDANAINLGKNIFGGMAGLVSAVPLTFEAGPIEGTLANVNAFSKMHTRLDKIELPEMDEARIDELLEKYGMQPVNSNTSNPQPKVDKNGRIVLDTSKTHSKAKTVRSAAAAIATGGTTSIMKNAIQDRKEVQEVLDNPYASARIALLYNLQTRVLEEEEKLNSATDELKNNGFPPVYYMPQNGESSSTINMNLQLREEYRKELETNLRQAMQENPNIQPGEIVSRMLEYEVNNGKVPIELKDMQDIVDEIAKDHGYDSGTDLSENIRLTLSENIMDIAEGRESEISKDATTSEVIRKVELALKNNNWDENTSQSEIMNIVTQDLAEEIMNRLSANELVSVMTTAINREGTLNKKPVRQEFKKVVETAANVAELNTDLFEVAGEEKYNAEDLIQEILNRDIIDNS